MSDAKHRPGPWETERVTGLFCIWDANGEEFANLYGAFGPREESQRKADAHLIAAAPEMLAMLKALEWSAWSSRLCSMTCPSCDQTETSGHASDCDLAELIAKAEGQTGGA